jgi:hypothetical protein
MKWQMPGFLHLYVGGRPRGRVMTTLGPTT